MEQHHTPWDGANGLVNPQTGTFYSTAGQYISATDDKGKTFGTVFQGKGTSSAAFGTVAAARTFPQFQGAKCPCLVVSITSDKGKTWTEKLVAQSTDYNSQGTVRLPVRDRVVGGDGDDSIHAFGGGKHDYVDCGPGHDIAFVDRGDDAVNCESVRHD